MNNLGAYLNMRKEQAKQNQMQDGDGMDDGSEDVGDDF